MSEPTKCAGPGMLDWKQVSSDMVRCPLCGWVTHWTDIGDHPPEPVDVVSITIPQSPAESREMMFAGYEDPRSYAFIRDSRIITAVVDAETYGLALATAVADRKRVTLRAQEIEPLFWNGMVGRRNTIQILVPVLVDTLNHVTYEVPGQQPRLGIEVSGPMYDGSDTAFVQVDGSLCVRRTMRG